MPVMDGYEATAYIKSHLQGQATAIIALTASTFEEERAIVIDVGCDDFVHKPFPEAAIWEKMAQHLGLSYIYEVIPTPTSKPATDLTQLNRQMLAVMSPEWIAQLYDAATQLNADLIEQLIAQIPEEYKAFALALRQKVNNFDFDQIMYLAQSGSTL